MTNKKRKEKTAHLAIKDAAALFEIPYRREVYRVPQHRRALRDGSPGPWSMVVVVERRRMRIPSSREDLDGGIVVRDDNIGRRSEEDD